VVSFTPLKFYPRGRTLQYILDRRIAERTTEALNNLNIVAVLIACVNMRKAEKGSGFDSI
jgi:hypothetical protein